MEAEDVYLTERWEEGKERRQKEKEREGEGEREERKRRGEKQLEDQLFNMRVSGKGGANTSH